MSNKLPAEVQLPVEVVEEIKMSAKKAAAAFIKKTQKKVISRVGLQNICAASYGAGATAYATKLHQLRCEFDAEMQKNFETIVAERAALNEAKALFEEVRTKHESGLLPDRFIYEKIKKFLYGE